MGKKIIVIMLMSLFICSRSAYAVFDLMACAESLLDLKQEIEHKVQEIEKSLRDLETRARQGFDLESCFKDPLSCDPKALTTFLNYINEDRRLAKGESKVHSAWGFEMPDSKMGSPEGQEQEDLSKDIETKYAYDRGQGKDLENLNKNRSEINNVVAQELALMFAKGATTHNDIQFENDSELYTFEFSNGNMDEILNAQNRVALMTAARLARILEFRSNIISTAATAEMTLQNQENLGN